MEDKKDENLDSKNQEEDKNSEDNQQDNQNNADALSKELETKNRQLYERAKKSELEVKELRNQLKNLADNEKQELKKTEELKEKEPDYGRLAFLNSLEIKHPDDQKIVVDEASRLKLSLSDVFQMEHIQAKLKINRETREAQAGMPSSKGRTGGTGKADVDYWIAKGGLPEDQELAEKVVDARMSKEKNNKFSDQMFNE